MLTTNVTAGNQTANASTNSRLVCDKLGHCVTAGPITGIMIDKIPPIASITTPANGASYAIGQTVLASYSCTDPVGGSGIAATNGCVGTVVSGAAIDTSAGAHSFSVTARDRGRKPGDQDRDVQRRLPRLPAVRPDEAAADDRNRAGQAAAVRRGRQQPVVHEHQARRRRVTRAASCRRRTGRAGRTPASSSGSQPARTSTTSTRRTRS